MTPKPEPRTTLAGRPKLTKLKTLKNSARNWRVNASPLPAAGLRLGCRRALLPGRFTLLARACRRLVMQDELPLLPGEFQPRFRSFPRADFEPRPAGKPAALPAHSNGVVSSRQMREQESAADAGVCALQGTMRSVLSLAGDEGGTSQKNARFTHYPSRLAEWAARMAVVSCVNQAGSSAQTRRRRSVRTFSQVMAPLRT
jgi:hypothetical protein